MPLSNQTVPRPHAHYPTDLTPELRAILGMPNFQCSPIAQGFRAAGEDIPRKAEAEQAFVLHWLTLIALEHGANWRRVAGERLEKVIAVAKAKTEAANG